MLHILFEDAITAMETILLSRDCPADKAKQVAREMARNSLEGTFTHGINRFARLVNYIDDGIINCSAEASLLHGFGAIENWDGNSGLGVSNAFFSMNRACDLAETHGIGMVALRNTNHWMRAASYGLLACERGMAGICFTNTLPNLPAWGATDTRLGNNPLVLAIPSAEGPIIADLAMSQFSYGALELARLEGRQLPIPGGYDSEGNLSQDPHAILKSRRLLQTGYWKGSALSFLLDCFASTLSAGNSVASLSRMDSNYETKVSQVFFAINYRKLLPQEQADSILSEALAYTQASAMAEEGQHARWPGQKARELRARHEKEGIPVDERVWERILAL